MAPQSGTSPILAWNGSTWIALGGVPSGKVRALGVWNGQLYAGGTFTAIGADPVFEIARWDGFHWQPLGLGFTTGANNQGVFCLQQYGGALLVGGLFYRADTGTYATIARWDGGAWSSVPQTQAPVGTLAVLGGQLYAGTHATVPGVYRLDVDHWTRLGPLADKSVLALASYGGSLIAAGEFTHFFTGISMPGIARWNGTAWTPLGSGIWPPGGRVTALAIYNGELIAMGRFGLMDGKTMNNVAAWGGTSWTSLGWGLMDLGGTAGEGVEAGIVFDDRLVLAGHFVYASLDECNRIVRWDGSRWSLFVPGINARVRTFLPLGTTMYAGGDFDFDWHGFPIDHLLSTDGDSVSNVSALGGLEGTNGNVTALTLHTFPIRNTKLVVAGAFGFAGGVAAANVASYTLGTWAALGNGFDQPVTALASYGGVLYAAGVFNASGATPLPHFARYGAGGWTDPGLGAFHSIYSLAVSGGKLAIGGVPGGDGVSLWDGTTFSADATADAPVRAMTSFGTDLVVAGSFTTIHGQPALHIARRDGATGQWSAMGTGFASGSVYALTVHDGALFAGGTFLSSGGTAMPYLARWTGSSWEPYGGGPDGPVYALASFGGRLQIGGDFEGRLGDARSPSWIQYGTCTVDADPPAAAAGIRLGGAIPNPTRERARIAFTLDAAGRVDLAIFDVAGRRVRALLDEDVPAGERVASWDGRDDRGRRCHPGTYFCRLRSGRTVLARTMVLLR